MINIKSIANGIPWFDLLEKAWDVRHKLLPNAFKKGMYEVLEYETTVEIHDVKGRNATVTKVEKVRFLQDNVIAFQDQAWGDGKILQDYKCSPGVPVDFYRSGHKTHVLISLRDVMNKGNEEIFHIAWKMKDGFLKKHNSWSTDIDHQTKKLLVILVFPHDRIPKNIRFVVNNKNKSHSIRKENPRQLSDKRWKICCEVINPMLNGKYTLYWEG